VIGNGNNKINPCYVEDVAKAVAASIDLEGNGARRVDIGGPHPISYEEFAKKALAAMGKKKRIIHTPEKLASFAAGIASILIKDSAFNSATIKRITGDVSLDLSAAKKELGIGVTDYDRGLKRL
jgi:NADH dehydrogenase